MIDEKTEEKGSKLYALKVFKELAEIESPSSIENMKYLDGDRIIKFIHEVRRLRDAGNHPNIANVVDAGIYHVGKQDLNKVGLLYFAEEFVKGRTLREILDEEKKRQEATGSMSNDFYKVTIATVCQVSKALHYMHTKLETAHLDIKPENVLIKESIKNNSRRIDSVVLTDFGNATVIGESYYQEGSILYRAPEQLDPKMKKKVDIRTDIWALGVMLYECITGEYPFKTKQPDWSKLNEEEKKAAMAELVSNIKNKDIVPPSQISKRLRERKSKTIDELIMKMLLKHPEQRLGIANVSHRLSIIYGRMGTF